mgnify:CR=1 FL=1
MALDGVHDELLQGSGHLSHDLVSIAALRCRYRFMVGSQVALGLPAMSFRLQLSRKPLRPRYLRWRQTSSDAVTVSDYNGIVT